MSTLVLLAAGLASRYGSAKQREEVGPSGEWILDYSIHDAVHAGCRRVVLVVRPEHEVMLVDAVRSRFPGVDVCAAHQRLDDIPRGHGTLAAGRSKPWGTGQAVLAAEPMVAGPFAVANVDDYYGQDAIRAVFGWLDRSAGTSRATDCALIAFPLGATLSPEGGVNRAVCETDADGRLTSLREVMDLRLSAAGTCDGRIGDQPHRFAVDTPVSMNLWGFAPSVFGHLRSRFGRFLDHGPSLTEEFLLPTAIGEMIEAGETTVQVLPEGREWCGLTHAADRDHARHTLARLVAAGHYPSPLRR